MCWTPCYLWTSRGMGPRSLPQIDYRCFSSGSYHILNRFLWLSSINAIGSSLPCSTRCGLLPQSCGHSHISMCALSVFELTMHFILKLSLILGLQSGELKSECDLTDHHRLLANWAFQSKPPRRVVKFTAIHKSLSFSCFLQSSWLHKVMGGPGLLRHFGLLPLSWLGMFHWVNHPALSESCETGLC